MKIYSQRKKVTVEFHREALVKLYQDQLSGRVDTQFMKAVLRQAIDFINQDNSDPKKVENWVVKQEKLTRTFPAFKLNKFKLI